MIPAVFFFALCARGASWRARARGAGGGARRCAVSRAAVAALRRARVPGGRGRRPRARRAVLPERRRSSGRPLVLPLRESAARLRLAGAGRARVARLAGVARAPGAAPARVLARAGVRRLHARRDEDAVVRVDRRPGDVRRAGRLRLRRGPARLAARGCVPYTRWRRWRSSRGRRSRSCGSRVRSRRRCAIPCGRASCAGWRARSRSCRPGSAPCSAWPGRSSACTTRARPVSRSRRPPRRSRARETAGFAVAAYGDAAGTDAVAIPFDPASLPARRLVDGARARGRRARAGLQRARRGRPARLPEQAPATLERVGGAARFLAAARAEDLRRRDAGDPDPARRSAARRAPPQLPGRATHRGRDLCARARLARAMKHAGPAALDQLDDLLAQIRKHADLREKSRGCFYRKSSGSCTSTRIPRGCSRTSRSATTSRASGSRPAPSARRS